MNHTSSKIQQIQKFLEKRIALLHVAYKKAVLCWISSHIGIPYSIFSNFKPSINKYILDEWQPS